MKLSKTESKAPAKPIKAISGFAVAISMSTLLLISVALTLTSIKQALVLAIGLLVLPHLLRLKIYSLWNFAFFANAALLSFPNREFHSIDLMTVLSMCVITLILIKNALEKAAGSSKIVEFKHTNMRVVALSALAFVVLIVLSSALGGNSASILGWINGTIMVIALVVMPKSRLPRFLSICRAIVIAMAISVAYDLSFLIQGRGFDVGTYNGGRFGGSLGDYELTGEYVGVCILLGITVLINDDSKRWKTLAVALVLGSLPILIATQSRGPVLLLIVLVPVYLIVMVVSKQRRKGRAVMLLLVLTLAVMGNFSAYSRSNSFDRIAGLHLDGSFASTLNRESVWSYFRELATYKNAGPIGNGVSYPYEEIGTYPHSLYLWLFWSFGYLGVLAIGLMICAILILLLRRAARKDVQCISALAILVFVLADEAKIEAARFSASVAFFWVVIALAIVAIRRSEIR
jgi:hypothetical protein